MHRKALDDIQRGEEAVYRAEAEKTLSAEMEYRCVEGERIRSEMEAKEEERRKEQLRMEEERKEQLRVEEERRREEQQHIEEERHREEQRIEEERKREEQRRIEEERRRDEQCRIEEERRRDTPNETIWWAYIRILRSVKDFRTRLASLFSACVK